MKDIAIGFFSFVLSILLQILIFNQISLLGYGCIFFHLIFVLISPLRFKTIPLMLMAFAMGLTVDVFSNSYGIHAFSLTLVSAIRGGIINLFFSKEDTEHPPNLFVGLSADYYKYAISMIFIYSLSVFALEAFDVRFVLNILQKTLVSTIATTIFVLFVQSVVFKKYNER